MIRAVIDTNILVSGLLKASGNEALILLALHQGLLRACLSTEILEEYAEVLGRPKFTFPPEDIAALLALLRAKGELFQPSAAPVESPDATDTKFLSCAHASRADVIVTGNRRHFPASRYGTTLVVSASELLNQITLEI